MHKGCSKAGPVPVETKWHTMVQIGFRQRRARDILGIQNHQMARQTISVIDVRQQEPMTLCGIVRARHKDRLIGCAPDTHIMDLNLAGLMITATDAVKTPYFEFRVIVTRKKSVAIICAGVTLIESRELTRQVV